MQQDDLFVWAEAKAAAGVIDAKAHFLKRETAHKRMLMIGYVPKTSGGQPVTSMARWKRAKIAAARAAKKARDDAIRAEVCEWLFGK